MKKVTSFLTLPRRLFILVLSWSHFVLTGSWISFETSMLPPLLSIELLREIIGDWMLLLREVTLRLLLTALFA